MQVQFNSAFETDPSSKQKRERLSQILGWVQEHTNLCILLASSVTPENESQRNIKTAVRRSMERGKSLVASSLSEMESLDADSLPETPRRFAIPLSGGHRFEEAAMAMKSSQHVESTQTMAFMPKVNPRASLVANAAALPLPSRRYLKKSVS